MFELAAFMLAIEENRTAFVREALRTHPELAVSESSEGLLPLSLACHHGFREIAETLLLHGAVVNVLSHSMLPFTPSNTPLHAAITGKNDPVIVHMLLDAGAMTDIPDSNGNLPIHLAARQGKAEIISLLLTHRADPCAIATSGETPLVIAEREDHVEAAATLRSALGNHSAL